MHKLQANFKKILSFSRASDCAKRTYYNETKYEIICFTKSLVQFIFYTNIKLSKLNNHSLIQSKLRKNIYMQKNLKSVCKSVSLRGISHCSQATLGATSGGRIENKSIYRNETWHERWMAVSTRISEKIHRWIHVQRK